MSDRPPSPGLPPGPNPGKDSPKNTLPTRLMTVGIEFAAVVAILSLGGWWLDGKWGTSPWLLLTGLFISTIGGLYKVWRIGKQYF